MRGRIILGSDSGKFSNKREKPCIIFMIGLAFCIAFVLTHLVSQCSAEDVRLFLNPQMLPVPTHTIEGRIISAVAYELEPSYFRLVVREKSGEKIIIISNRYSRGALGGHVNLDALKDNRIKITAKRKPNILRGEQNEYYALNVLLER